MFVLYLILRIAQRFDRAVVTGIFKPTAKAAVVTGLALVTRVCMLHCAKLTQ